MPTTTATGLASGTRARMPAAEATTVGTSSLAAPWRSPNRPAHQRVRVDAAGWTSRATATRVAAVGTHTIPPPTGAPTGPAQLLADFLSGVPDLASFPRGDWLWAQRESCRQAPDRKSTRLNSSHGSISYAVFCLKKKKTQYYEVDTNKKKRQENIKNTHDLTL